MAQAVPNLCVSRKVFLKHKVNWNTVCGAIQDLSWRNIWLEDDPIEVLNEHLSLLVGRYVPTKVIRYVPTKVIRYVPSKDVMLQPRLIHKDKPWFDDKSRHAFGLKQEAYLGGPVIALGLLGRVYSLSSER